MAVFSKKQTFVKKEMEQKWRKDSSSEKGFMLLLPKENIVICASFGTGDNLLREDRDEGYNDYLDYALYEWSGNRLDEFDSGMYLFNNEKEDFYENLKHTIETILSEADYPDEEYLILCISSDIQDLTI